MTLELISKNYNMFLQYIEEYKNSNIKENNEELELEIRSIKDARDRNTKMYEVHINYNSNIEFIEAIYSAFKRCRYRIQKYILENLLECIKDDEDGIVSDLQVFKTLFEKYINETQHKWVWLKSKYNDEFLPLYLDSTYHQDAYYDRSNEYYVQEYLNLNFLYIDNKNIKKDYRLKLLNEDILGKSFSHIMFYLGLFLETQELYDEYKNEEEIFKGRIQKNSNLFTTNIFYTTDYHTDITEINKHGTKVINISDLSLESYDKVTTVSSSLWSYKNLQRIPSRHYIKCYNLDSHKECYVHSNDMEEYVYDDRLRDKLILPKKHSDLLDILTSDIDMLGDIIEGKGNGTCIILEGPPGCGKTLTVEVYAEMIHKPLFKINVSDLSTDINKLSSSLHDILYKARKLGCVLLLDECEIFVRERGSDLHQNAIVTEFLRQLEYFDGILFMTSNRIDSIDEAIKSRCIATIRYEKPSKEEKMQIWKVLAKEFNIKINDSLIEELTDRFPDITGRDIKELLKLTYRYCVVKNYDLALEYFISCAQFRNL